MGRGTISLMLLFLAGNLFAQGSIGDGLFDNFEYIEAIKYYNQEQNLTLNQKENLAYAYYVTQDFEHAEKLYKELVVSEDIDPIFHQFYAISLKNNGKYDNAKTYFEKALAYDSTLVESKMGLQSLAILPDLLNKKQVLEVVPVIGLNNAAATYGAQWYKDGILYCAELINDSLKRHPRIDVAEEFTDFDKLAYGNAERPLSAIYYAELLGSKVTKTSLFAKGDKYHVGNFFLPKDSSEVYFTKVDLINKWDPNNRRHPRLFKGKFENGILTDVSKVKIKKLSVEDGSGHPVITSDGKTMYFASNKPGGYGGSDLYKVTRNDDGSWSEPINLGANINTEGDELSPAIYNDVTFYFATNGRPGFGGLDVFKIDLSSLASGTPKLLDAPINSTGDDFGLLIDPKDENNGLITSNRKGGMGDDDIYSFRLLLDGIFVQGIVKDLDGNPVPNALIKIYDKDGNEIAQTRTDENGRYNIELEDEGNYEVVATIPGYGDKELVSIDENWDNYQILEMVLEPMLTAQGQVKNEDGSIIANADVELRDQAGNIIYKGKTDENGYYQFPLEEDLTFTVFATDGNLKGSETFTTDDSYDTMADKDIILKASDTFVDGIVLNEDGTPAVGAEVQLLDGDGKLIATTYTDKDGKYHFDLEKDKDYQILAITDGYQALENIYTGDKYDSSNVLTMTLQPIGKESFALVEDNTSKEGLAGVKVTLIDDATGNKLTTYTDENGEFKVYIRPNHSYTINLEKDKYYPKSVRITAGKKLPEKVDLSKMGDFGMDYAGYDVDKIYFELDSYKITARSKEQLKKIIKLMKANKKADITIKSYADCRGAVKYNVSLSWKRSQAVKKYLIAHGIKKTRILTESLGATNFVNNCTKPESCTEAEHSLNRRSEFEIDFHK